MMQPSERRSQGQALVEFALILVVLLFFIFVIIESGRLFQGWLTVQNAARAAMRYAITGQYDPSCLTVFPPCLDPRVRSIEDEGRGAATGLVIDPNAEVGTERSFSVEVWGQDAEGLWHPDYAGAAGKGVRVRVSYWMPIVTPLLRPIAQFIRLSGQVVAVNEEFGQIGASTGGTPGTLGDPTPSEPPTADVSITKEAVGATIFPQAGEPAWYTFTEEEFTYSLVIVNLGPMFAEDVTVQDVLPAGVTYLDSTVSGGGSCSANGNTVDCVLPNLQQLGIATVDIQVQAPSVAGVITNVATVDAGPDTIDPVLANNTASFALEVKAKVDLSVVKSDSPDPVHTDEDLVYTITVSNAGPGPAEDVVITDTLPVEITDAVVASASQGDCPTVSQTTVICELGQLADGGTATVTIVVDPYIEAVVLTNQVVVGTTSYDTNLGNNNDTETTVVSPEANLALEKSGPESVLLGESITYSIVIQNSGPDPATSVVLEDNWFPDIVSYVSGTAGCQPNVGGHDVCCELPDIPAGGQQTVQITVQTGVGAGSLNNRALVDAFEADENTDDNEDNAITFIRAADLSVQKGGPDRGTTDQPLTYDIGVSNLGPDLAPAVTLVDTLPAGVTYVSNDGGCSVAGQQVTCNLGDLGPLAAAVVHITVQPTQVGTIVNTASASSASMPDPVPNNDTDGHSTLVADNDLALTKTAPAVVTVNQAFNYTISVHNNGSASATQVVVTDALAPSLTFLGASGGTCSVNANNLATCTMADIPGDGTAVLTLNVRAGQAGTIENTAAVDAFEYDPNPANNSDSATTEVTAADINTAKSAPACVVRNTQFDFTITVSNLGPSAAGNIVVTDVLDNVPEGIVTFVSAVASNGGSCDYDDVTRTVTCSNISLNSGGVATVTITVLAGTVPSGQGNDIIVNQAHAATASVFDPNPNNNTSLPVYVDVLSNCN